MLGATAVILSARLFSAILLVAIATTLVSPPLLMWTFRALGRTAEGFACA